MYRRLLLVLALATGWLAAAAQGRVSLFEFEASVGYTHPIGRFVSDSRKPVRAFALEGRFNFRNHPLDLGLEYYFGKTPRAHAPLEWKARVMGYSVFLGRRPSWRLPAGIGRRRAGRGFHSARTVAGPRRSAPVRRRRRRRTVPPRAPHGLRALRRPQLQSHRTLARHCPWRRPPLNAQRAPVRLDRGALYSVCQLLSASSSSAP